MRLLQKCKDGGIKSPVDAYVLCEFKSLFSIMFLKFNKGTREEYHSHAFNAFTWFLKGDLTEHRIDSGLDQTRKYKRSLLPKFTPKKNLHRVTAHTDSWCFTIRGPWDDLWFEYNVDSDKTVILTHGRKKVFENAGKV